MIVINLQLTHQNAALLIIKVATGTVGNGIVLYDLHRNESFTATVPSYTSWELFAHVFLPHLTKEVPACGESIKKMIPLVIILQT